MIGFVTGLLIARALNPAGYGDLMFLLGSFVAIRSLLDMGSSSAFYTFLSQRARGRRFYLVYFAWLALQFVATLALLALILFSVEGVPQKDVAEILECSVELVKWNVFQARKKLKELLADYL